MTTTLTAAAQAAGGRVLLQLTWTTVTSASIARVHADGTVWPLRDANPVQVLSTTGVGAIVFDHEAPLDQAVTYLASSTQAPGTTFSSSPVTVTSDPGWVGSNIWLTHPTKPALTVLLAVTGISSQTRSGRNGLLQILGSTKAVSISDVRVTSGGSLTAHTTTTADTIALRALLDDGGALLMRPPGTWSTPWQYVAFGDVTETGSTVGPVADREWAMPYTVVATPAGQSLAPVGSSYANAKTAYATYALLKAGEADYNALKTKAGP